MCPGYGRGKKRKFSEKQTTPKEVIKTNRETSANAGDIRNENDLAGTISDSFILKSQQCAL